MLLKGNMSGHRTLITFCKLTANYMYIAHTFSWLFSQHGQGKWNIESGNSQGILKASTSGNPDLSPRTYHCSSTTEPAILPLPAVPQTEASMRRDVMSADPLSRSSLDLLTRSLSTERTGHRSPRSDHAVNLAVLGHSGVGKSGRHVCVYSYFSLSNDLVIGGEGGHKWCDIALLLSSCGCIKELLYGETRPLPNEYANFKYLLFHIVLNLHK